MSIQRFFQVVIMFLLFVPFASGQIINKDQVKPPKVEHQAHDKHDHDHDHVHANGAYHCGGCDQHLFDSNEVTVIEDTDLHYHGIGTDDTKSSFHCAACQSHLGYLNHEHNHYEVLNENVTKQDNGKFVCSACEMPLFDLSELKEIERSTDATASASFFNAPIAKDRIVADTRKKFYSVDKNHLNCKNCNATLGAINRNTSGGFGVGVFINKVKKQPRKN